MGSHFFRDRLAALLFCILPLARHLPAADCNFNGSSDSSDLLTGRSRDCNGNGIPDECDLKPGGAVFSAPINFPTGFSPSTVVASDLDADGHPDLVTANPSSTKGASRTLAVFLNDGKGGFGPSAVLNVGNVPKTAAVADLDSDGRPDLISANYLSRDLSVLHNQGGGKFTDAVSLPLEGRPLSVVTGDFDGDGRGDLAVPLEKSSRVGILLNRREGKFEAAAGAELGAAPTALLGGDFDGDGRPDLAGASRSQSAVAFVFSSADGTFGPARTFTLPAAPASLAAGDFDLDGNLDLAAGSTTVEKIWLFRNGGRGSFGEPGGFPSGGQAFSLAAADFDGDGTGDLALTSPATEGKILLGDGRGAFAVGPEFPGFAYAITPADLDGDVDVDLAMAYGTSRGLGGVSVIYNGSGASFANLLYLTTESAPELVLAEDLDGDARADLAMVNSNGGGASVLLSSERRGGIGPVRQYPGDFQGIRPWISGSSALLLALDFDGDGDTDLCSQKSGVLVALLNDGRGTFKAFATLSMARLTSFATAADLDRDGNLDLITIVPGAVSVAINNGNGTFADGVDVFTGEQPIFVTAGDLDGEGHPDLAVVNPSSSKQDVSVLLNRGDGTFAGPVPASVGGISSVTATDLDADGSAELITGGDPLSSTFWIGRHLTRGFFRWVPSRGGTSDRPVASDLNGDGLPELLFLLPGQKQFSIHSNVGTRINPGLTVNVTTPDIPHSLAAADFNGDGQVDLATAEAPGAPWEGRGSVSLLLNRTPPSLSQDLNRDGIPDGCVSAVFHRGDPNGDGAVNLSDAVSVLDFLFTAGAGPGCLESADADNDGRIDLSDAIGLLDFLFFAGVPPAAPGSAPLPCGPDPDPPGSVNDLGCEAYAACQF